MMTRLVVFFLLSLFPFSLSSQQVNFRPIVVNNGNLRLSDLVEYQEGLESYLFLPIQLSADSAWVLSPLWVINYFGLPKEVTTIVDRILLLPATWDIPRELLEELGKWLRNQTSGPNFVFELRDVKLLDPINPGLSSFQLTRFSGEKTFNIPNGYWVWRINPAQSNSRIRAFLQPYLPVARLQKTLSRGAALSYEDFQTEFLPLNQFFRRPLTLDEIHGRWTLTQPVRVGDILYAHQVQAVYDVEAQSGIRVIVQRAGIKVEIRGIALDGGNVGDRIRVRLADSGRNLRAVVSAEGEVHVENL